MLSQALLKILVCPVCHHTLTAGPDNASHAWLHCTVVAATTRLRTAFR